MKEQNDNGPFRGMTTLSECMEIAVERSFSMQFVVNNGGISVINTEKIYLPQEVQLHNFYRFEGASDPDDASILYLIETTDGMKGTIADAYGVYADDRLTKFLTQVPEIPKTETGG